MDNATFIKIRDNFKSIKVKMSDGTMQSPAIIIKLDNDAWVDDAINYVFYDDANGIMYYTTFDSNRASQYPMIGTDHVNVPMAISAADYGEIQEVYVRLTRDALNAVFKANVFGAKYMRNGATVELTDKLKDEIYNNYILSTTAGTDKNNLQDTTKSYK